MARRQNPGDDCESLISASIQTGRGVTMIEKCTLKQKLIGIVFNVFAIAFIQEISAQPVYFDPDTPQLTETESAAALDEFEQMQTDRKEFIKQLIEEGGEKAVQNDNPRVLMTPRFMALDFDTQLNFARCRSERPAAAATFVRDCFWSSPS